MYYYQDKDHYGIGMDGSSISIPSDPDNSDYKMVMAWVGAGNTIRPYVAPPEPEPLTVEQKLQIVGLTVEDLKTVLGIGSTSVGIAST